MKFATARGAMALAGVICLFTSVWLPYSQDDLSARLGISGVILLIWALILEVLYGMRRNP